ncbi:MAG: MFS transporter [Candidatus Binatia bacterium]
MRLGRAAPLAVFWFFFFGGIGIFFPYYALYLREDAGLAGGEIGLVIGTIPLIGLVAQPFWGNLADRTGARSAVLAAVTVGSVLGYLLLAQARSFPAIVIATAALASCSTSVLPAALAVTFAAVRGMGPHAFGLVRVWGTVGHLLTAALFPWVLAYFSPPAADGTATGLRSLFYAAAACSLGAALVWPWMPRDREVALRARRGEWRVLLRSRPVLRLIAFVLGGQLFLQGPNTLFPLLVRARGGDLTTVGQMWVVMLLVEIPLVLFAGAGVRRLGARGLLAIGVLVGGVRWALCALAQDPIVLYAVQLLHGVMVVGLLLGGPIYLESVVPQELRSTAQGLLAMIGLGIGSIGSNTAGGWLLEHFGVEMPFLVGGLGAVALGCAALVILPRPEPPAPIAGIAYPVLSDDTA